MVTDKDGDCRDRTRVDAHAQGSPFGRHFESDNYFSFWFHQPDNWIELLNMIEDEVMELAAELIEKRADIQARDNMNRSVLWHACHRSWLKSIPWLSGMGSDINERDLEVMSAFDAGCMHGERMDVEAMLSAHPEMDAQDAAGDTALIKCGRKYIASGNGAIFSSILSLLCAGADPDIENNKGESFRKIAGVDKNLKSVPDRYRDREK